MTIPADIAPPLTSQKSRKSFMRSEWFCTAVIEAFRFLIDEHGYRIKEISHARHDLWVTFRNANVEISISTEFGCDRWGTIEVMKDARSTKGRFLTYFHQLLPQYYSEPRLPRFAYDDHESEFTLWASIFATNWDNIMARVVELAEEKEAKEVNDQLHPKLRKAT
jgi:hypothetical protein